MFGYRPLFSLLLCALLLATAAWAAPHWEAVISPAGAVTLREAGKDFATLEPGLFEAAWQGATLLPALHGETTTGGVSQGEIHAPGGGIVKCALHSSPIANGLHLAYTLTPQSDIRLNTLFVGMSMPVTRLEGGMYSFIDARMHFPAELHDVALYSGTTSNMAFFLPSGERLDFDFTTTPFKPQLLLQDDRKWSQNFSLRIGPSFAGAPVWPAGKALDIDFNLTVDDGIAVNYDSPVTITAGPEWIPLAAEQEIAPGSALDFSHLTPWHTPAGALGRVMATPGGAFAFAKDAKTPVRFYGCNLVFSSLYLPHADADRLAERLQRLGYNAVRIHHYETELVVNHIPDGLTIDPVALDQLDYLCAALKARGIYLTTDLFVSRPVSAATIWDGATGKVAMDEYKMAVPVNPRAYANFTAFTEELLTHVNPYTKMRWADDPALAWLSLVNENNPGNFISGLSARVKADWTQAWDAWLAKRYPTRAELEHALGTLPPEQDPAKGNVPLPARVDATPTGTQLGCFLADTELNFFQRTRAFLRDTVHCPALLTDNNSWTDPIAMQAPRLAFDYVDNHFYIDHPRFLEQPWRLPSYSGNTDVVADAAPGGLHNAFVRLTDKPFTLTEFNYAAPEPYRGVGGLLTGALAALQDWSGMWRFAYSHSREGVNAPMPVDYFNLAADPLNQAADRAVMLLFRRGDLRPAPHAITLVVKQDALCTSAAMRDDSPPWSNLALLTRVGMRVRPALPSDPAQPIMLDLAPGPLLSHDPYAGDAGPLLIAEMRKRGWLRKDNPTDLAKHRLRSETGELTIDGPADTLTIDTPRTAGGYAPDGGSISTPAVTISVTGSPATVWVSSLDDAPISTSHRLLITHLTDLQNTGARFGDTKRHILLRWGTLPYLVHAGAATVTLHLAHPERAHVYSLSTEGRRLAEITTTVEHGALVIPLDVNAGGKARMMYEVTQ